MKKLFSLVLCAALILGCCPIIPLQASADAVASGTCGVNLTWTLDDAGTLTISGTGPMRDYSWGSTPWFDMRSSIKTVIIGDGVTTIGDYSIYSCDSLTSVTIGDSVITIGGSAFAFCEKLSEICLKVNPEVFSNDVSSIFHSSINACVFVPSEYYSTYKSLFSSCKNVSVYDLDDILVL